MGGIHLIFIRGRMGRTHIYVNHGCQLHHWNITHMESHKLLFFNLFMFFVFFLVTILPSATSLSFNFTTFDRNGDKINIL